MNLDMVVGFAVACVFVWAVGLSVGHMMSSGYRKGYQEGYRDGRSDKP